MASPQIGGVGKHSIEGTTLDKTCAYCDRAGKFTREHIWPDWLLQRTNYTRAFLARAGKIVGRSQTINDVCASCNNGPLSILGRRRTIAASPAVLVAAA